MGSFWTFLTLKLTNFETRFWTRDTCHVGSEDTMKKPLSSRWFKALKFFHFLRRHRSYGHFNGGVQSTKIQKIIYYYHMVSSEPMCTVYTCHVYRNMCHVSNIFKIWTYLIWLTISPGQHNNNWQSWYMTILHH